MAISTAQYIDLLFKKLQGVAKTATATQKSASNESIASPALLRGDIVWTQADQIPSTAQVVANVTQGYLTTSRIECTADTTVPTIGGIYPTWLTNLQYWIPQEFGSTWPVKVWVDTAGAANPTVTGTQIFAPGISGVGEFYFDTQAGVLNFIGETIPSTLTAGKSIFITGYRYVGQLGVTNLPSANIGNIQITGNTIATLNTNGDIVLDPNGSGNVTILANTSVTGNITASGFVSATGNVTGNYFLGNGSQLTGVAASSVNANALIGDTLSSNVLYSSLTQVGTLSNVSVSGNVVGGNVTTAGLISATGSVTSAANIVGGNITTVGQVTSTTVSASANVTGGNVLTDGIVSATGNILAGNVITAGPSGNISGANVISGTTFTATGNITGGNLLTAGLISASGTITGSSLLGSVVSLSGNITGGNVVTGGLISATGNIQGNVFIGNGAGLTSLTGANVTGTVANATYALNANSATYADHANIADVANSVSGGNVSGQVANALIAGTVYTNAQPNITSVGTLTSLTSSGNVTGGNLLTGGLISSTGTITSADNITGGNLLTGGLISATSTITTAANITGGNVLTGGLISATSTITGSSLLGSVASLSGNVTGGNLLTGGLASVSGNVTGGNLLTAGLISATGNIQGGNVNTNQLRNASGNLTIGVTSGNLLLQPSGNIVLSANTYINNLAYPEQDGDAATKQYVDNFATTGISYHQPVAAATTTTLATTTGGSITYTQPNGVANGIGALLTTTGSFNLIDTANVQTVGTRILVKNEANAVFNGVYTWANSTNIIRSSDADSYGADQTDHLSINDYFYTTGGNVNAGTAFIVSAPTGVITFGTSNIEFSTFSTSQVYSANTSAGISLNGTVINAKVDDNTTAFDGGGNIVVKAGANLTTPNIGAATGTSISLTGNATSGNVLTGGVVSATANVIGGNVLTGGLISATSTITSAANITGGNLLTGGLISSTGTITSAANINANNVIATTIVNAPSLTGTIASLSGNVTGGNLVTGGAVTATGNITGGNIITSGSGGNISGANVISGTTLTATGNVIGGNVLTGGVISATGTVTGSSLLGTVASLSGNVTGGNVVTGGLISATGNITGGNIVTVGKISTSGNVYGNAILSDNYFYANGQPIPTGIVYTAAISPPAGPDVGDQWYDTTSDVLYEYINDGTSNYWVDTTSPAFAGGVVANVAISGTLIPIANVTYDIGTSSVYFRNTYTQNLYTNNRLPAYNMPLGAVVQTVMSSSLGGSITNSTNYADVTYATVTITPSSATSRVLILATGTSGFTALSGQDVSAETQLVRSPSTSLQIQTVGTSVAGGGVGATGAVSYSYMDAPGTTSAVTYKLQQKVSNASSTLTSTNIWLIALEIAAS